MCVSEREIDRGGSVVVWSLSSVARVVGGTELSAVKQHVSFHTRTVFTSPPSLCFVTLLHGQHFLLSSRYDHSRLICAWEDDFNVCSEPGACSFCSYSSIPWFDASKGLSLWNIYVICLVLFHFTATCVQQKCTGFIKARIIIVYLYAVSYIERCFLFYCRCSQNTYYVYSKKKTFLISTHCILSLFMCFVEVLCANDDNYSFSWLMHKNTWGGHNGTLILFQRLFDCVPYFYPV